MVKELSANFWDVKRDSWHYRLYQYWQKKGGKIPANYKENLCHYWRVVVFWAPWQWFFKAEWKTIGPWLLMVEVFCLTGAIAAALKKDFWVASIMLGLSFYWLLYSKNTRAALIRCVRPIAWLGEHLDPVIIVMGVLVLLAVLGLFILWVVDHFMFFLSFVGAIAILVGLWFLMRHVALPMSRTRLSRQKFIKPVARAKTNVSDAIRLSTQYVVAKKRRICPFINFVD